MLGLILGKPGVRNFAQAMQLVAGIATIGTNLMRAFQD